MKTDRRDVAALAEARRTGVYRRAHRASAMARDARQRLRCARTACGNARRPSICSARCCAAPGCGCHEDRRNASCARVDQLTLPAGLATVLAPLRDGIAQLSTTIAAADTALATRAARDPIAQHLMTAPGAGPNVALTFHAVLDTPARFGGHAGRASAFLGLVPSEDSSAERRHRGAITKVGPGDLRALLVQASWGIGGAESGGRRVTHVGAGAGRAPGSSDRHCRARAATDAHPVCHVARWRRLSDTADDAGYALTMASGVAVRWRGEHG